MNEEITITIEEKLNSLADLKLMLKEKENAFENENADLKQTIKDLEKEISEVVLNEGQTIKTEFISAVWNKGKTTWDGKLLEGYAVAHPEILAARRFGEPTVSFRMAKK